MGRFKNMIVGHADEPIDDILFNPNNWRIHTKEQEEALEGVYEEVGTVQRVIINLRTSPEWGESQNVKTLVDGHERVKLFAKNGETTIPALYVDLNPQEELIILGTLDPLGAMAATDREKWKELREQIETENERLNKMFEDFSFGFSGSEDYAVDFDSVDNLAEYDTPETSLRAIIEFEDEDEEAEFYSRVGIEDYKGKVRYKYTDLKFGDEDGEESEEDAG